MKNTSHSVSRFAMIVIVALATVFGFSISHWLMPKKRPIALTPEKSTPTASSNEANLEVNIPENYLTAANIAVEPIIKGNVETEILAPATVTATPNGEATVVARASGTITKVNRQLGDTVRAGDVLARVDSLEAASMSAERSTAAAKVELARKNYAREASLYKQGVSPRQDMETAQSALAVAEAELKRASLIMQAAHVSGNGSSVAVITPISGKITTETALLGAFVQPQAELFRIARSDAIQVEASVTAADMNRIQPGDTATLLTANGSPVKAVVHSVTPTVNGTTRSATAILKPDSSHQNLIIGEGIQVRLHVRSAKTEGLSVPEDAVQNIDNHDAVFVRTTKGFRVQDVLIGTRSGGMAQIISGVRGNEQVATRNAFLVKAELSKNAKDD